MTEIYPAAESYAFPRTPHEQVDDELRLYATPYEFRKNVVTLHRMYGETPFLKAVKQYAEFATVIKSSPDISNSSQGFNRDFYTGGVLATHTNIAPGAQSMKRRLLTTDPLGGLANSENRAEAESRICEFLIKWADEGEGSWIEFYDLQTEEYRERACAIVARLYDDLPQADERSYEFMLGYTFTSNLVWGMGALHPHQAPV